VDEDGFKESMAAQKKRAKETGRFKAVTAETEWVTVSDGDDSEFLGYERLESSAQIRRYAQEGDIILLVLDQTPFYAESGGQIGDTGTITGEGIDLTVLDVKKENNSFNHICQGTLDGPGQVSCSVDKDRRQSIKNNHTATHLMYKALKTVLGDHINQAGSLVHPDYLRFDLTHFEKITEKDIQEIEQKVNDQILSNTKLDVSVKNFDDAKKAGAEALFGEKYGDRVRVVQVGDYSMELCGGTHVDRTGDIGSFKITEESSLSSGVRRIVAVTGQKAVADMQSNAVVINTLQSLLNTPPVGMTERVEGLLKEKKNLEKKLKHRPAQVSSSDLLEGAETAGDHKILIKKVSTNGLDELKALGDHVFNTLSRGIAVLFRLNLLKPQ
jgi:alanyl-tRNA synthetase